LPEKQLHFAAYPTRSKRPDLLSLWDDAAQERGEVKKHGRKQSDIPNENITATVTDIGLTSKQVHDEPKRKPLSDDELVIQHRLVQELLAEGHVTQYARWMQLDLEREMARSLDLNVFERDTFERVLNVLHARAWPDAATRPERLVAHDGEMYVME
jgi:hypothetical protein